MGNSVFEIFQNTLDFLPYRFSLVDPERTHWPLHRCPRSVDVFRCHPQKRPAHPGSTATSWRRIRIQFRGMPHVSRYNAEKKRWEIKNRIRWNLTDLNWVTGSLVLDLITAQRPLLHILGLSRVNLKIISHLPTKPSNTSSLKLLTACLEVLHVLKLEESYLIRQLVRIFKIGRDGLGDRSWGNSRGSLKQVSRDCKIGHKVFATGRE